VIAAAAAAAGHSVYLDIYGGQAQEREGMSGSEHEEDRVAPTESRQQRVTSSKSAPKPRLRSSLN
jgi:hypothetical protein